MRHGELIVPFMCACAIWCPISWIWWSYWQLQLLEHIQKNHRHFDRTVLWPRERNFWFNLMRLYLFDISRNNLGDEHITYLKSKLRPALIGFLGGQFVAAIYTVAVIMAAHLLHWV